MTPREIRDLLHDLPPASVRRREEARDQMRYARAAGTLLEPEPARRSALRPLPADEPELGQWARQRTRCERGHGRHGPYDESEGTWHLVKRCKWAERGRGCCSARGRCGAKLATYDHGNEHRDYLETADAAPDDACRKCLAALERDRVERDRWAWMIGGTA